MTVSQKMSDYLGYRKKRSEWSAIQEIKLLKLWAERVYDLRKTRRNKHVYQQIAMALGSHNRKEVTMKISNFTQRYRCLLKNIQPTDDPQREWKHFNRVHKILGPLENRLKPSESYSNESFKNTDTHDSSRNGDISPEMNFSRAALENDLTKGECNSEESCNGLSSEDCIRNLPSKSLAVEELNRQSIPAKAFTTEFNQLPASDVSIASLSSQSSDRRKSTKSPKLQKQILRMARKNQKIIRSALSKQLKAISDTNVMLKSCAESNNKIAEKIVEVTEAQLKLERNFLDFLKRHLRD